jgi:hypothetical protein
MIGRVLALLRAKRHNFATFTDNFGLLFVLQISKAMVAHYTTFGVDNNPSEGVFNKNVSVVHAATRISLLFHTCDVFLRKKKKKKIYTSFRNS